MRKGYFDLMLATFLIIFIFLIFFFFSSIIKLTQTIERISEDLDKKTLNYVVLRGIIFSDLNESEKEIFKEYKAQKVYNLIYFYFLNQKNENFKKNFTNVLVYRLNSYSKKYLFYILVNNEPVFTLVGEEKMTLHEGTEGLRKEYGKLFLPFQNKKIEIILIT